MHASGYICVLWLTYICMAFPRKIAFAKAKSTHKPKDTERGWSGEVAQITHTPWCANKRTCAPRVRVCPVCVDIFRRLRCGRYYLACGYYRALLSFGHLKFKPGN